MASSSNTLDMRGRSYADYRSSLAQRLMTFYPEGGGPSLWKCPYVHPDVLVRVGFIYSGQEDSVECVFCHENFYEWKPGDDPKMIHIKQRPECEGIKNNWVSSECHLCEWPCLKCGIWWKVKLYGKAVGHNCFYHELLASHNGWKWDIQRNWIDRVISPCPELNDRLAKPPKEYRVCMSYCMPQKAMYEIHFLCHIQR